MRGCITRLTDYKVDYMTHSPLDKPMPVTPTGLKAWIDGYSLTQTLAAEYLGTNQSTVSRWLSGETAIPGCMQHALTLLSIDPRWIAVAVNNYPRKDFFDYAQPTSGQYSDDFESELAEAS